jgi:hypothetical protein
MPPVRSDDYSNAQQRNLLRRHLSSDPSPLRSPEHHRHVTPAGLIGGCGLAEIHGMRKLITCRPVLFIERHDGSAYDVLGTHMNCSMISGTVRVLALCVTGRA